MEGSALWLLQDNLSAVNNLRREDALAGIDPDRLIFAERMSLADHLARHKYDDLFLDTLPYNAYTTTSDALWAGLPVLTVAGKSFASRVSASLLSAVGLSELVMLNQSEFESYAIALAHDPHKLDAVKEKLLQNRPSQPLFDTLVFTKNLEAAYEKMYAIYQDWLPPEMIEI